MPLESQPSVAKARRHTETWWPGSFGGKCCFAAAGPLVVGGITVAYPAERAVPSSPSFWSKAYTLWRALPRLAAAYFSPAGSPKHESPTPHMCSLGAVLREDKGVSFSDPHRRGPQLSRPTGDDCTKDRSKAVPHTAVFGWDVAAAAQARTDPSEPQKGFRPVSSCGYERTPDIKRADCAPPVPPPKPIPSSYGVVAHSDGDVVMHALCDGLFGAVSAGDIGEHFPDTDPRYRGAPSSVLLCRAAEAVRDRGWQIANVDVTVILDALQLGRRRKDAMRDKVASVLQLPADRVSLKAKTNEGLGSIGRREAIACHAVVCLTCYSTD